MTIAPIDYLFEPGGDCPSIDRIRRFSMPCQNGTRCELTLQFGLFFDGTDNNLKRDEPQFADTNIARLWRTYPDRADLGIMRLYVPGVGTAFDEIGSQAEGWYGTAFGIGCEARVIYALLKTLEFVHTSAISNKALFTKKQLNVLCLNNVIKSRKDEEAIMRLGYVRGLQELGDDKGQRRQTFFRRETNNLKKRLANSPVQVLSIAIDVFGFSRGAAEARAYTSWLNEILDNGKYAGVPLTIRFVGLFDTVASAGMAEMIAGGINNTTSGHSGWARPDSLRVPTSVSNCVHLVAMHEIRKNFPIDSIAVNGKCPAHFHELAYPGSHSDLGGGYPPGALGIAGDVPAPIGDASKLSQIPLNHMHDYALAAGVPLDKRAAHLARFTCDPFAISPALEADFKQFVDTIGNRRRRLSEWMLPYLAWRWQLRSRYAEAGHVRLAKGDKDLLLQSNKKLIADAAHLIGLDTKPEPYRVIKDMIYKSGDSRIAKLTSASLTKQLDIEARDVLRGAIAHGVPDPVLSNFFDMYVHDSYAGFCKNLMEPTGYWRHRKGFQGSELPLNADVGEGDHLRVSEVS